MGQKLSLKYYSEFLIDAIRMQFEKGLFDPKVPGNLVTWLCPKVFPSTSVSYIWESECEVLSACATFRNYVKILKVPDTDSILK